jgi:hypothetical protein
VNMTILCHARHSPNATSTAARDHRPRQQMNIRDGLSPGPKSVEPPDTI